MFRALKPPTSGGEPGSHPLQAIPRKATDMFSTSISARSSLVAMAVIAGLLAVAGPASAARGDLPSPSSTVEAAMLLHGDFSTFISQVRPDRQNSHAFSGDAYDNEMGVRDAASPQPRP